MDANSVLWIQSETAAGVGQQPVPPPGWTIDFLSADCGISESDAAGYAAIVLDLSVQPWRAGEFLKQTEFLAAGPPVLIYDPCAVFSQRRQTAALDAIPQARSAAEIFPHLARALEERRGRGLSVPAENPARQDWERLLVGDSHPMRQVSRTIGMVGGRRATVLITGETGTGKEIAARALHLAGPRRRGPLVAVNCSALPATLLEAELFGHVRGAFTGAHQSRAGRFELAQGGTLFLDEIGEMTPDLQAKLLRVLQEREFQRLGSSETVQLDIRVVAATNCDLRQRIEEGRFREDLFYRLSVIPIHMPPLRARREDIPALAAHFARKICAAERIPLKSLTGEALDRLRTYAWPGNVRELENAVEAAVALSGDRLILRPADFPLSEARPRVPTPAGPPVVAVPEGGLDYERTLALIERSILGQALQKTGGNKKAAAEMLRLKRTTLAAKMRSLDSWAACNVN